MRTLPLPVDPDFIRLPADASRPLCHSYSRVLCPVCRRLLDGERVLHDGRVYLRTHCPDHGPSESLISSDEEWFLRSQVYLKPGSIPLRHATEVKRGCPDDCGLCPDHEQHTCLPIIEITNHCDLDCPICLVENRHNWEMSVEEFERILDGLIAAEGALETINLSGGEPTLHSRFLELLDRACARPEIARVSVATNGRRLASEPALAEELARRGVYVNLQFDGLNDAALASLRGSGAHRRARERALDHLEQAGVRTTLIATLVRGVNEQAVGELVRLLFEKDFLLSLSFQPAAFTGTAAQGFPHDPRQALTIPDIIQAAEVQTGGRLRRSDFLPLPCSHPSCFALTYLLKTADDFVPLPRFVDLDRYLEIIANRGTIRPDESLEGAIRQAIDDLWTGSAQAPDNAKILAALKRTLRLMYPDDRAVEIEERLRIGEGLVKTIFIHAYMDAHTFEIDRIKKCCTHYALPDGRLIPACAYNAFHRDRDPRFIGPVGERQP